ncbi:GntR family transcriptional regulator [Clostridium sp. AM58-1XD]|uniref:GntR family transcriptional regulator n=1 Tax=Clostridium sp. AM58-1XD TaxID=2292307 RepID=UPI000E50CF28|nr:GntR family transcriptional regulator [Clostridium sp. AM58-1XD]RGY95922.1 GntR family transcriptional regulator [Clostridium sp. AM58-1XD]
MSQNQQLYQYLYQTITSQFYNGTFIYGQEFPSQHEICLQYNAGITTVRKVMKILSEEGFIHTAQGQPSVVTYRTSRENQAAFLVQSRDEIADAYQGLGLLMPVLYREGAKRCNASDLRYFDNIMNNVSEQMELQDHYRLANTFFTALLRPLKNRLIIDLELDSENYLHVPYIPFPSVENPFATTAARTQTWFKNAIDQIEKKQFDDFCDSASKLYCASGQRVDSYLYSLDKYTEGTPKKKEEIRWFRAKVHSELYARLAMTIVRRIITGEFDNEPYLPSIPKLMEEYKITKNTARRVVNLLNSLGIAKTIDKKGSVITRKGDIAFKSELNLVEPVIQERLSLFLEALQIVALTAHNCASSITFIPDNLGRSMENRLRTASDNRMCPLSFQLLINAFIQLLPYHSLKNIFRQLDDLLIWGHYMQAIDKSFYPDYSELALAMDAVVTALKGQRSDVLPDAFSNAFSLVYKNVCMVFSKHPINPTFNMWNCSPAEEVI